MSSATAEDLEAIDRLLALAVKVEATPPEYVVEVGRLATLLLSTFEDLSDPLLAEAAEALAALAGTPSQVDRGARAILRQLEADLAALGDEAVETVAPGVGRSLGAFYRLGQSEVASALGWRGAFTIVDFDAIAGMRDAGLFWVGDVYGKDLPTDRMLLLARETLIEKGLGRREAGRLFLKAFGAELPGRSEVYWRGFASTMGTRSRSFGAIGGLAEAGAVTYEYVNPDDERTSDVCRALDGTEFTLSGAVDLRERLRTADTPDAWKTIAPWPRVGDLDLDDNGKPRNPAALQARGIAWPPLHFHCRSAIVARSWRRITEADLDAAGYLPGADRRPPKE